MESGGAKDPIQMESKDYDGKDYCLKTTHVHTSDAETAVEISGINSAVEMENVYVP